MRPSPAAVALVCPTCRAVYRLDAAKLPARPAHTRCRRCNGRIAVPPRDTAKADPAGLAAEPPKAGTEVDLAAFVGPHADRYLPKFKKFRDGGRRGFAFTWHWPAALFGCYWFLYRRLYLWAALAFAASFVPGGGLLASPIFGLTANYLYYRRARGRIDPLRKQFPRDPLEITLRHLGGVNRSALIAALAATGGLLGALALLFGRGLARW